MCCKVTVPVTNRSFNRCYSQIFLIHFISENPGIAYASEAAFLKKAFSERYTFPESISSPSLQLQLIETLILD